MASTLTRIPVVRNPHYKPHGPKSYVYMLNKYNITPTQPGRFSRSQNQLYVKAADGTPHKVYLDTHKTSSFPITILTFAPGPSSRPAE